MSHRPDLAERIGTTINELDIDFSRLTLVGWFVSLVSLAVGGVAAYFASNFMMGRDGWNLAVGMTFCLVMIAVTTFIFLALRWAFRLAGLSVIQSKSNTDIDDNANRSTLNRMATAGMDMTAAHAIDFWHLFKTKSDADRMRQRANQASFEVVSIEANEESGGYDVHVQVQLVPTLDAINKVEQTLANIAKECNGRADGWGVRQRS
jgi:regulator of RNase E activity RraB